jgi:two-component system, NtrC family, sensor histidine kinase PilS
MSSLNDNIRSANDRMIRMTRRLVLGRLVAVIVLFAISWLWYGQTFEISGSQLPRGPLLVFLSALTLTAVYFLLLVFGRFIAWQAAIQFVIDAGLISWLVYLTGGLTSPFITLYIVLIGITSIFLKPLGTLLVSVAAVILFVLASILPALNLIDATGPDRPLSELLQRLSFHVVAFLIVGLLAARLSERRSSGEKLEETARSLADLRALHERIVESIRSGLITTDLSGSIYTANAAATEITGLTPDELKGRSIFSLFGDISEAIRFSVEAGGGEEATPRFETDLVTPDGFAVHIGYSVSPLFSENNEAKGLIIAFQDLTEIRSMEESVRRKDRLAAVGRIGAGLAHEIRNPLGAMRGAIQVLESTTPPDSVQSDLMGIILRESDRLNSIITNFLSYARPKAGNFTETDVCEAIRDTMTLLRHSPDLKPGHKIVEDIPQEPVTIMADVTQLKQIFWNLARNALAAMPEGGELRISLTRKSSQRVRIVVADTGQGMTPEQVEQLFEPFSNSTTGGTGLGLSIVYQIIRDHNGAINVTSSEGQGTSITVELPVENIGEKAAAAKTANGDPASTLEAYLNVKGREKEISS